MSEEQEIKGTTVLTKLIEIGVKLDDVRRAQETQATEVMRQGSEIKTMSSRIDRFEEDLRGAREQARRAQKSSSDLEEKRREFEDSVKRSVDAISAGLNTRIDGVESKVSCVEAETKAQTPIIQKILDESRERRATLEAEEKMRQKTEGERAEKLLVLEKRRTFYLKLLGVLVPVLVAIAGIGAAYVAGRAPAVAPAGAAPALEHH